MLFFDSTPAVTLEAFDEDAARLINPQTAALLRKVELYCEDAAQFPLPVRKFYDWENALRNSLLDIRKKSCPDAGMYKRNEPDFYSGIAAGAAQAAGTDDLLEAEKILDRMRWQALDDFGVGHYTDFTMLAFYRIRLLILRKYSVRTAAAGNQVLENILGQLLNEDKTN